MTARILLLALLPIIAITIYMDAQSYDPSTLDFSKNPGEQKLLTLLPQKIVNLQRSTEVRIFTRDNLFELVNGHAEYYLSAGFKTAAVTLYRQEGDKPNKPSLGVDIFDMDSSENAFGVLMEEGQQGKTIDIGALGVDLGETILFMAGRYYVKVITFAKGEEHKKLAGAVAKNIGIDKAILPQFTRFPEDGALPGGRGFFRSDYMGVELFTNVFEQKYQRDGKEFRAFLITPSVDAKTFAEKIVAHYAKFDIAVKLKDLDGTTVYYVHDPYEGWTFIVKENAIIGVAELEDENDRLAFLTEVNKINGSNNPLRP